MSFFTLNARSLTPFLYLNFLAVEDWIITKIPNQHKLAKNLRSEYKQTIQEYEQLETEIFDVDQQSKIQKEQSQPQQQINQNQQEQIDVHTYRIDNLSMNDLINYKNQLQTQGIYNKITLKIANFVANINNGFHENLPVFYPLIAIGSFCAPVIMTRSLEAFFILRGGSLIYDYYLSKYKEDQGAQYKHFKNYEFAQSFTVALGIGLVIFCCTVPQYKFLLDNVNKMNQVKSKELVLLDQAKSQLKNLK